MLGLVVSWVSYAEGGLRYKENGLAQYCGKTGAGESASAGVALACGAMWRKTDPRHSLEDRILRVEVPDAVGATG